MISDDTTITLTGDEMGIVLQALAHWILVTRRMVSEAATDDAFPVDFFREQITMIEAIVAKLSELERNYFAEITQEGAPTEEQLIETAIELELRQIQEDPE